MHKISVLIATYNRAEILRQTLGNFTDLNLAGLLVEIVIVDNNSDDNTPAIVESFKGRLPLVYLFESRPGKNCALNKALNEVQLGDLVVFTDDDVKPCKDWFKKIIEISERWPENHVFGGKVYMEWPSDAPGWARDLEKTIYAQQDYSDIEKLYENRVTPVGPNFWVRSSVFRDGERYNETIGPTPDSRERIMGSETSFLLGLLDKGYHMVYSPEAVVGHYVTPEQTKIKYLRKRAASLGRWKAISGQRFRKKYLYEHHPLLWKASFCYSLLRLHFMLCLSSLIPNSNVRIKKEVFWHIWIAYSVYYLKHHQDIYQHADSISNYSVIQ